MPLFHCSRHPGTTSDNVQGSSGGKDRAVSRRSVTKSSICPALSSCRDAVVASCRNGVPAMSMTETVQQTAHPSVRPAVRPMDAGSDLAYQRYQQSRFFPALDGLRCVSILGVIAFHSGLTNPSFFGRNGGLGVEFFFVISGFLITTLLLRERSDTGFISLKKFYIRRSLRIFPMYFTVLALYCVATLATDRHTPEGREFFHRLPIFFSFTSNWFIPRDGHFAL